MAQGNVGDIPMRIGVEERTGDQSAGTLFALTEVLYLGHLRSSQVLPYLPQNRSTWHSRRELKRHYGFTNYWET